MSYSTKQRDVILNSIKKQNREFIVKDIYDDLNGNVGLTTIYRFIDKLVSEGKINKQIGFDNITRYEYLDECGCENHFYLKCEKCGLLIHIDCDCISQLSTHILCEHKFRLKKENIIINGICNDCIKEC